jgi:protein-L-isoaspartate(D-aspartate) O-methyltransferase
MTEVDTFAAARRQMVDCQLRPNRITDEAVLAAIGEVARERFVPAAARGVAYRDEDVEIANGRYLVEPLVAARLLQSAEIAPGERVLDVAGATGYLAALASRLAGTVTLVEGDQRLAELARQILGLGATVVQGDPEQGVPNAAPFDVILVGGAVDYVPEPLKAQLAEGGRLLAIVMNQGVGEMVLIRRVGDRFATRVLFNAGCGHLPGFARKPSFAF